MKKLFILSSFFIVAALALLQSGCAKDPENIQNPDVTASADTIHGTLKYKLVDNGGIKLIDWPFGPGTLRVIIGGKNAGVFALQSNGNFVAILPSTVSGTGFTKLGDISIVYGGTVKVTPETVKYDNTTQFLVDYTDNNMAKSINVGLVTLNANNTTYRNYYYYFYDQDGSIAGTGTAGNMFNWTFTKGWGIVEANMSSDLSYMVSSKTVAAAPVNAIWTN